MIMVESRFRVANGMESAVRDAFLHRPGLVDDVVGFLGMDVYQAAADGSIFHLVTRWTDQATYDAWHRSDAHRHSHAFIPRGLKLDATFTRLTVLNRLNTAGAMPSAATALGDSSAAVATWLADAGSTYVAVFTADGRGCTLNSALADRLGHPQAPVLLETRDLLANDEADELAARIQRLRAAGHRGVGEVFLLNAVNAHRSPFTLRCRIDVQPGYVLMVGEGTDRDEDRLRDELLQTNNQLAVLARERERQRQALHGANRELARVHAELASAMTTLETSYWHIERIGELLPLCLDCGDVKSAGGSWEPVREFLMANARTPFLSHGYCPPCAARYMATMNGGGVPT